MRADNFLYVLAASGAKMTSYRILATLWLDWTPHATDRLVWRPNGLPLSRRAFQRSAAAALCRLSRLGAPSFLEVSQHTSGWGCRICYATTQSDCNATPSNIHLGLHQFRFS